MTLLGERFNILDMANETPNEKQAPETCFGNPETYGCANCEQSAEIEKIERQEQLEAEYWDNRIDAYEIGE